MKMKIKVIVGCLSILSVLSVKAHEGVGTPKLVDAHAGVGGQEQGASPSGAIGMAWDSKYISEGRNNLEEGGLVSTFAVVEFETEAGAFGVETWFGSSVDTPYTEFNVALSWAKTVGQIDLALGYSYLAFTQDDEDDHELSAEISSEVFGGLLPFLAAVYSVEADGSFFELGLTREWEITERLAISPYALIGFNQGYVADGHDGANHAATGLVASIALLENLHLDLSAVASFPLDKEEQTFADDEALEELYVISGGLTATF